MGGTPAPAPLPRLKEYEKVWIGLERMRKATLDAFVAAGVGVTGYCAEDQSGTLKPPAGMDLPYPEGLLPPVLQKWDTEGPSGLSGDFDKFLPQVIAGDKRIIDDLSLHVIAYWSATGGWAQKDALLSPSATGFAEAAANAVAFAKMPEIGYTKPPWWDYRAGAAVQAPPGTSERSQKMLLLMRDYTETNKWVEKHMEAKDGSYALLLEEIKKDKPDQAKIDEYVKNLEYARYMMAQTKDFGGEVHNGKRPDWTDDDHQLKTPSVVPTVDETADKTRTVRDPPPPPAPVPSPVPAPSPVPEKPRERNKCSARRR